VNGILSLLPALTGWPRRGPAVQGRFALPEIPPLTADGVHIWRLPLDRAGDELQRLRHILSPDELARADRFYFANHRDHFIAGRGLLRVLLAGYRKCRPEELTFVCNEHGKPALVAEPSLRFNLSHSHGLAVCAVTHGREVGIDVERVRGAVATDDIAQRHFSPRELAAYRAFPQEERAAAFFRCWTRKEAYLKATGRGLSVSLASFDVSLTPGDATLLDVRDDPRARDRWTMRNVDVPSGYLAALVVAGAGGQTWCGDWAAASEAR